MVSEYILANYGQFHVILTQPLGAVDEKLVQEEGTARAIALSRPFRPEVDAIVLLPRYFLIIEAKVWNIINGLAKLPLYKSLVPFTPELKQYQPREVLMQLVVGWTSTNLEIIARDMGVQVVEFHPPWLEEVVEGMHKYWTKEYREERQKKLELREYFGIQ